MSVPDDHIAEWTSTVEGLRGTRRTISNDLFRAATRDIYDALLRGAWSQNSKALVGWSRLVDNEIDRINARLVEIRDELKSDPSPSRQDELRLERGQIVKDLNGTRDVKDIVAGAFLIVPPQFQGGGTPPPPEDPPPPENGVPTPPTAPTPPGDDDDDFSLGDLADPEFWRELITAPFDHVFDLVGEFLPEILRIGFDDTREKLIDLASDAADIPEEVWLKANETLDPLLDNVIEQIEEAFGGLIGGATSTFRAKINELLGFLSVEKVAGALDFLSNPIGTVFSASITIFLETLENFASDFLGPIMDDLDDVLEVLPPSLRKVMDIREPDSAMAAFAGPAIIAAVVTILLGKGLEGIAAPYIWAIAEKFLPRLIGQDEMIALRLRYPVERDTWDAELHRLGIPDEKIQWLIRATKPLPFVSQLRDARFREAIDDERVQLGLQELGYDIGARAIITAGLPIVPQISDVIRFGVREVYQPFIREAFELDADFPPDILPDARRVGLADEETRKYWAAHWDVPSIQQSYRMHQRTTLDPIPNWSQPIENPYGDDFHRIISEDILQLLLRTQDMMRPWRDPLVRVSFRPLGRRDLRRFFRPGTLNPGQLYRGYLDAGFSEENADLQVQFAFNLEREATFDQLETILGGQAAEGTIELDDVMEQLEGILDEERILEPARQRVSARIDRERLGSIVSAFRQAFRYERITEPEIREELDELDLPVETVDHIVKVERIRTGLDFLPFQTAEVRASGRGTPVRRYREGLIDSDGLADELSILHYDDQAIASISILADLERNANIRLDQVAAFRSGLRTGRLSEDGFRDEMQRVGIQEPLVDVYVLQDEFRRRLEAPTNEEEELRATGKGVVLRRFREGFTTSDEFRSELGVLGYPDREIEQYQLVADLEFELDWKFDIKWTADGQFKDRTITADDYLTILAGLGMDEGRAVTHLARNQTSLRPAPELPAPVLPLPRYQTPSGRVELKLGIEEFRSRQIEEAEFRRRLDILELPAELQDATVELELFRLTQAVVPAEPPPTPFYLTDEGKIRLRTLTTSFRQELITEAELGRRLLELEVEPAVAEGLVEFEIARRGIPEEEVVPTPTPFYLTEAGRIAVRTLQVAFRDQTPIEVLLGIDALLRPQLVGLAETLTPEQLDAELEALEVPDEVRSAMVIFEVTRAADDETSS